VNRSRLHNCIEDAYATGFSYRLFYFRPSWSRPGSILKMCKESIDGQSCCLVSSDM
jgi:hypothetical protein